MSRASERTGPGIDTMREVSGVKRYVVIAATGAGRAAVLPVMPPD